MEDDPGSASARRWSGRAGRYGIARRSCSRAPTSTPCRSAGAVALMIPPDAWVAEHPDDVLDGLDGLVLAGGADIDPGSYGDARHPKTTNTRPDRDHAEIALALRALERDLPVLGICRGMQLINVALRRDARPAPARRRRPHRPPPRARLLRQRRPRRAARAGLARRARVR